MGPRLRSHHEDRGHNIDIAKESMKQALVFMSHWIAEESEQQRLSKQWVKDRLREPKEPRKRKRQRKYINYTKFTLSNKSTSDLNESFLYGLPS